MVGGVGGMVGGSAIRSDVHDTRRYEFKAIQSERKQYDAIRDDTKR
jgi:hypothetical protein